MSNEKFLISKDDTTIQRFIELYDYFDIDELKILADVFKLLNEYELKEAHYVENGRVKFGIKIFPPEDGKTMRARNNVEIVNNIQTYEEKKDLYFFKALSELTANSSYISINDRLVLNNLFDDFSLGQRGIGEVRDIGDYKLLPCHNKNKQLIKKI